jgi:hypothetical protein
MTTQQVTIVDDFFNLEWQARMKKFWKVQTHAPIWFTNHDYFPKHLVSGLGVILVSMLPPPIDTEIKNYMIERGIFKRDPKFFSGLLYQGRPMSFTHWHRDDRVDFQPSLVRSGMSIYLNDIWEENWGGWFCWKKTEADTTGHMIIPKYNRAVILSDDVLHSTTCVSTAVPEPRYSLQLFFERDALADEYQYNRLHTGS